MIQKIKNLINKAIKIAIEQKEIILYLIFGVLTTLVNFVVYILFTDVFSVYYLTSNIIAWIAAVAFAYVTNKIWVFESKTNGFADTFKEAMYFIGARLTSGAMDMALMFLLVSVISLNDMIAKVIVAVFVVIANYVLSKLLVFKQNKEIKEEK